MRVTGGNGGQEEVSKLVAYCMSSGPVKTHDYVWSWVDSYAPSVLLPKRSRPRCAVVRRASHSGQRIKLVAYEKRRLRYTRCCLEATFSLNVIQLKGRVAIGRRVPWKLYVGKYDAHYRNYFHQKNASVQPWLNENRHEKAQHQAEFSSMESICRSWTHSSNWNQPISKLHNNNRACLRIETPPKALGD